MDDVTSDSLALASERTRGEIDRRGLLAGGPREGENPAGQLGVAFDLQVEQGAVRGDRDGDGLVLGRHGRAGGFEVAAEGGGVALEFGRLGLEVGEPFVGSHAGAHFLVGRGPYFSVNSATCSLSYMSILIGPSNMTIDLSLTGVSGIVADLNIDDEKTTSAVLCQ